MQIAAQAVMQSLHLEAGSTTFGAGGPCPGMPFPQVYLVRRVVSSSLSHGHPQRTRPGYSRIGTYLYHKR